MFLGQKWRHMKLAGIRVVELEEIDSINLCVVVALYIDIDFLTGIPMAFDVKFDRVLYAFGDSPDAVPY